MDDSGRIEELRRKVAQAEEDLRQLKDELARAAEVEAESLNEQPAPPNSHTSWKWPLSPEDYERYSRQLVIPGVGTKGQLRLKSASVLLVGAGGLGCPAAAYIAAAGVGTLGLVDGDTVEVSNLHRQVAHATSRVGMPKVDSAIAYLRGLNPTITYRAHHTHLTPENAEDIVSQYDMVLDCTDHPAIRYLVSDICVLLRKPLVSASAFKTDGQLMVLNNPAKSPGDETGGPCYRCVFPRPPPAASVVSCGEGGILGPVVGVMGVLQALEAIKLIAKGATDPTAEVVTKEKPSLLLFSGMSSQPFRSVFMRPRKKGCIACSAEASLTLEGLRAGAFDYVQFCGVVEPLDLLKPHERISAADCNRRLAGSGSKDADGMAGKPVLLDVREREHYDICSVVGSINVPIARLLRENKVPGENEVGEESPQAPEWLPSDTTESSPIYIVCRVGNDSQLAVQRLKDMGLDRGGARFIGDVKGGMRSWKSEVDPTLPFT